MATTPLLCSDCGCKIINRSGFRYQKKAYCQSCYNKLMKSLEDAEKQKVNLLEYIRDLFGESQVPGEIVEVIDRMIKNGRKIRGIQGTLYYYYEIMGHEPNNIYLVGKIIKENYEAASRYFIDRQKILEYNQHVNLKVPVQKYTIKRPKSKKTINYRMEDL